MLPLSLGGKMTKKSAITVSVQLVCIAVLVLTGPVIPRNPVALTLAGAGVAVIAWAVVVMGFYNLRIEPDVHEQARLVTRGPYRMIRHPMYTGGTLIVAGWLWEDFTWIRLIVGLLLVADFMVKLRYEERLRMERFAEYTDYVRRTKRLVPYVY